PERTGALVSPDRALTQRVAARLTSWGLEAEESSGRPLMETPIGSLLDLAIEAAATRLQPVALICLLKHPLCRMGMGGEQRERGRRTLELAVFRAPYIGRGLADIRAALERARVRARSGKARLPAVRGLGEEDYRAGRALLGSLEAALGPLEALLCSPARV